MLKGFVSGEEKDIVRIPMKGKNLFDKSEQAETIYVTESVTRYGVEIPVTSGTYTVSGGTSTTFAKTKIGDVYGEAVDLNVPRVFTLASDGYMLVYSTSQVYYDEAKDGIMLNLGSSPLPYEPYGYQEGWEVRDSQDRLIWGREDELQTATGTLPFKGYTLPVKVKSLLGNAVQNGTPAPDNIITPEMCGVRTGNLFDVEATQHNKQYNDYGQVANATGESGDWYITDKIPVDASKTYIRSVNESPVGNYIFEFDENKEFIAKSAPGYGVPFQVSALCKYIGFNINNDSTPIDSYMFNSGSTPLPYEPYGWKVPFENHGENLFDSTIEQGSFRIADGTESSSTTRVRSTFMQSALPAGTYTINASGVDDVVIYAYTTNSTSGYDNSKSTTSWKAMPYTFTTENSLYLRFAFRKHSEAAVTPSEVSNIMLSLGSTPKSYSPYLNETIPVYLGEVPTVRRIKKVVFTGQETWTEVYPGEPEAQAQGIVMYSTSLSEIGTDRNDFICSHFFVGNYRGYLISGQGRINGTSPETFNVNYNNGSGGLQNFKEWLASEYAAGHPVTLWYALATEQTSVVNEPLCKISTYADELTTIQVHGLSAPLYGIGDYKDTLNLSTGVVTRKVKKLVLTGNEDGWREGTGFFYNQQISPDYKRSAGNITLMCTHYQPYKQVAQGGDVPNGYCSFYYDPAFQRLYIVDNSIASLAAFKSYLAAQYAAGTPVTVWYVLNTPETETVTVPTGMTGEIEGYLTQVSTPTPTNRSVPKWNGVEETGGTYAVTVYTPPEIPTTTGQNTLTVDVNLAPSNLTVEAHAKKINVTKIHYGFKIDKSNDDSESAVIYTHDAVTMTPAHMDFANDRFDYGSWGNAFFVRDCYPVALNLDGTIAYRLDPDDYTKKTDGTASDIFYELLTAAPSDWSTQWKQYYTKDANDNYELNSQGSAPTFAQDTYYKLTYNSSFAGNFMMAFPKVWFYRHEDSQYNYIEISNHKLSDDWKCYAHINASGQEVDFIYLPLFKGVIKDSKLRSLPGQIPQGNTTATDEANAATALGSRWQIWDHSSVELINDLLTLMSKSIDSQGRFGKGRESGYNSSDTVTYGKLQTGTLVKGGKFHGFSSSYKEVKVFGIEGFWANRWDRLQGMLLVNNVWKIKMTPPYNFTGTDFVTLSNASVPTGNGYLSKVQTSEYGSIPASIDGGSSTKYFNDYFYKTATDTRVALRGCRCNGGARCGFRYVGMNGTASNSDWSIGASPVYK